MDGRKNRKKNDEDDVYGTSAVSQTKSAPTAFGCENWSKNQNKNKNQDEAEQAKQV